MPPVPSNPSRHIELIETLEHLLKLNHITIRKEQFALRRDGLTLFGVLQLQYQDTPDGMAAFGLRTSNNRSMSIQICAGLSVFVCDNMVFRGDLIALNRKHTSGLHLRTELSHAILRFQDHFGKLTDEIANLKESAVFDTDAKAILHVKTAMEKRLKSLTHPGWINAVTTLIYRSKDRYFRWHDSGDLQSVEHLRNIIAVCKNLPRVKFWLPTREYQTVEAYRKMGGRIPANLCIRYSAHLVGGAPPLLYGLPVSTISSCQDKSLPGTHHCPAARPGNTCGRCRACWNPRIKIVDYSLK